MVQKEQLLIQLVPRVNGLQWPFRVVQERSICFRTCTGIAGWSVSTATTEHLMSFCVDGGNRVRQWVPCILAFGVLNDNSSACQSSISPEAPIMLLP